MSTDERFDLLHSALQHHIVNSLGWPTLRPLQMEMIEPVLAGEHVIATAPTAGGKTEAAILPLFSRMLSEDWRGLTVIYVCPLRALLNNLYDRLRTYGSYVGREVGLWHGDTSRPDRKRLLASPPDVLLTTPESLESMLVSRGVDHKRWFSNVRAVVIDEAHAFAGDDRGWHLLAVLERITRLSGREVQRVALSATLGNPEELLDWMTRTSRGAKRVVRAPQDANIVPDVGLDFVGSLDNAAIVISRLHRGEKRLVFVDSRARAEQLAVALRNLEVTTFVSHGSLGVGERRSAETAFREERDCVIVATSTLELGIDVGDLDRVIQVGAPPSVASFLQRIGRTGRRTDTVRNALLLATDDEELLRCASVLLRWGQGYVEPIVPPSSPLHLIGQQLLALSLQESGVGRNLWSDWLGKPFLFGDEAEESSPEIVTFLISEGFLVDDAGILGIGEPAEKSFGRQHFMELLSVFTSPPVFSVRHGRNEIGLVPDEVLIARPPDSTAGGVHALVLAGRSWAILSIDWNRRVVQVEPSDAKGVARWLGGGQPLSAALARGVREVLAGAALPGVAVSKRAEERMATVRDEHTWVQSGATTLVFDDKGRVKWWTFAGWKANLALAQLVSPLRKDKTGITDLHIALDARVTIDELRECLRANPSQLGALPAFISSEAITGLKFSECLPRELALLVINRRLDDSASALTARDEATSSFRS